MDLTERVWAAVERLRPEIVDTLSAAIRIPSINPNYPGQDYAAVVGGEGRVSRLFADVYAAAGCEVDVFGLVEGRENAVGRLRGTGGGRSLIYNGHVDVVPPDPAEEWVDADPWSGRVADGRVWGRGASDMKSGIVAQAFAARALREAGIALRGDLILEAVVGEENMEHLLGTTACIDRGYRADAAIVSEASGPPVPLAVCPVSPGAFLFTVTVEGKATHSSMRGETLAPGGRGERVGVSAIDRLLVVYEALRRLEQEWESTKRHPLFEPRHFSIMPGVIRAWPKTGPVTGGTPDRAFMEVVAWAHPDDDAEVVHAEVEACISRAAEADSWLAGHPPRVEWTHHWPRSSLDPSHPIVAATARAHEQATGRPAVIRGFGAVEDTTFFNAAGIPAISYGPGDLRVAHAIDESVDIEEVVTATATFALLAAEWCGVA